MPTILHRRQLLKHGVAAAAALALPWHATAAELPSLIKIVVPLPAGGALDNVLRGFSETLSKKLRRTVIVENKPGASGLIAAQAVVNAAPETATLLYLHGGLVTLEALTGKPQILKQFKPIARVTSTPHLLVVRGDSPYKTQADLIAAAQAAPGKLNYGSGGYGSPVHMMVEVMRDTTSKPFVATHIPYKGSVEAVLALVGGQIDFVFAVSSVVAEHIKTGSLRALSVAAEGRIEEFPNVPTVAEAGLTGYRFQSWGGIVASSRMDDDLVAQFATAIEQMKGSADFLRVAKASGVHVVASKSPSEFSAYIAAELAGQRELVKRLGLKAGA